ncbi:hypothetical protein JNB11_07920 [Kocuria palustris]|nr:hypothetical protein [Kocuria palustris]
MFKTFTLSAFVAIASAAAISAAPEANSTVIVENVITTTATITSCEDQKCVTSEVPQTLTETKTHHVTQWIEHCEDNACTKVPATHSTVTKTIEGVETVYTTECPLTTQAPQVPVETVTKSEGPVTVTVTCTDYQCLEEKPKPTEAPENCVVVYVCNGEKCVKPLPTSEAEVQTTEAQPTTEAQVEQQPTTTTIVTCPPEGCNNEGKTSTAEVPQYTTVTQCPAGGCNGTVTPSNPPANVDQWEGSASSMKIGFAVVAVAAAALL